MRRFCFILLCSGALQASVKSGRAAESPVDLSDLGGTTEEWLGEGNDLKFELAHVILAGKRGNLAAARRDLERIAGQAEARGSRRTWLEAEKWWVRFTFQEDPSADISPAMEDLLARVREWGLGNEEIGIFAMWADLLRDSGQWMMAVKAQDRATQIALDMDRVPRALEAFLEMARLCRRADHGWRLRQVWVRIDQVLKERPVFLSAALQAALGAERAAGVELMAQASAGGVLVEGVDLQPSDSRVLVSAPDREVGRTRFVLTNASPFTVQGTLKISPEHSVVTSWETGESGAYVSVGKGDGGGTGVDGQRALRLLPGQQMPIFVERGPNGGEEKVAVEWSDGKQTRTASGEFYFENGLPAASVVNVGEFRLQAGWSVPLYHEIYYRGSRVHTENLRVTASAPCRLEIFDYDTGRLLAVDADGDGAFQTPGDRLLEDMDGDSMPDLQVGDRARAVEIFAWPAGPVGDGITITAGLRDPAASGAWREDASNKVTSGSARIGRR
ncbi:MAG: hypothetical protein V4726_19000 [Verrucomicrobiota bacterium]